jgi:hypothetical protein
MHVDFLLRINILLLLHGGLDHRSELQVVAHTHALPYKPFTQTEQRSHTTTLQRQIPAAQKTSRKCAGVGVGGITDTKAHPPPTQST